MLRAGSCHNSIYRYFFNSIFQLFLVGSNRHKPDYLLWITVGSLKHFFNQFFRGQYDGQPIGPALFNKQAAKINFRIRFQQPGPFRFLCNFRLFLFFRKRAGKSVNYILHNRPAGYRIVALNVPAQVRARNKTHRVRRIRVAQRHAVCLGVLFHIITKAGRN